jgi:hypothetical protein
MCSSTGERFRIFRAEKTYAVKAGRWYFEFEAVTAGDMRVGWSRPGCQPDQELGSDERAFAFDGFKVSALLGTWTGLHVANAGPWGAQCDQDFPAQALKVQRKSVLLEGPELFLLPHHCCEIHHKAGEKMSHLCLSKVLRKLGKEPGMVALTSVIQLGGRSR